MITDCFSGSRIICQGERVPSVNKVKTALPIVSAQDYRNAMSHYAGAVQVVTTDGAAGKRGVTITACCSVSDDPATVLICLQKVHADNQMFIDNGVFAVNTIGAKHQNLSDVFSGRFPMGQDERFEQASWKTLVTGAPVLSDALSAFDCRIVSVQDHHTHLVIFGEVVALHMGGEDDALIYLNRRYHYLPLK